MAADDNQATQDLGEIHDATDGGVAGTHAVLPSFPVHVAPGTAKEFNHIVTALTPIACFRVDDVRFAFDSSFVQPEIATEMQALGSLRERHKLVVGGQQIFPRLSIFGHADPTGDDDYNKELSGRRALAIFALLTRSTQLWEKLYSTRIRGVGDKWGLAAVQTMLKTLDFDPGAIDGVMGPKTKDAVKRFQANPPPNQADPDPKLSVDGDPGPQTRAALFDAYMEKLCGKLKLTQKDDFLAGTDSHRKGDVQGCGEFNPLLLFSQAEEKEFSKPEKKTDRDRENAPNRRVMVLLFRPGTRVDPGKWPCPRAEEGKAGCIARFWSDGEKRRSEHLPDARREFKTTQDSFACRYYHRLASRSPCELGEVRLRDQLVIRLHDFLGRIMPNVEYEVECEGAVRRGRAGSDAFLRETIQSRIESCLLRWSKVSPDGETPPRYEYKASIFVELASLGSDAGIQQRLNNLGYPIEEPLVSNLRRFQANYQLEISGVIDDRTKAKLKKIFETQVKDEQEEFKPFDPATGPPGFDRT